MTRLVNFVTVATFVTTLAACATQPQPVAEQSYTPPQQRLDAKTQLETGRQYR